MAPLGDEERAKKLGDDGDDEYADCEILELPGNVYACAFVLAQNATPGMYSFFPHKNPQLWLLWGYLVFITFSQTLALMALTVIRPPVADSEELFVDCNAPGSEVFRAASAALNFSDAAGCVAASSGAAFEVGGGSQVFRRVLIETSVYTNTFKCDPLVIVLQLACCIWVMVHSYFSDFENIEALLRYRDFNRWFVVWKQEELRANGWTLLIPLTQWALSTAVVSISWCLICGYQEPVDIVLNSMALTFVSEVAEVFARPVLKHYSETAIAGLDPNEYGTAPIYFLVTEYDEANAAGYTPLETWYVLKAAATGEAVTEMHKIPGLLTDFKIRMHPTMHQRPNERSIERLRTLSVLTPPAMLCTCFAATYGYVDEPMTCCFVILAAAMMAAFSSIDFDHPPRVQLHPASPPPSPAKSPMPDAPDG